MVLVGSVENLPSNRDEIALSDLVELPLVIAHGFRRLVDRWAEPRGIKLNYVMELDSIAIIKEMIMRGFGYSIIPYSTVHREALNGDLGILPIVEPRITRDLVLTVNARRPLSAAIKAVCKIVVDRIKDIEVSPPLRRQPSTMMAPAAKSRVKQGTDSAK
jgi:LysR family nitrogen assimilation transcriptional regulator